MTEIISQIENHIKGSINAKLAVLENLSIELRDAAKFMADQLHNGHKILCCGNGGSASDAQHFSAELLGRFERERPSLPAIALTTDTSTLTAIANDYAYSEVFVKQINALSSSGDILLAISTSGNSENVLKAIETAHKNDMTVIALTGHTGGKMKEALTEKDFHLCVPSNKTAFIQESHIMILHCLCDIVDTILFPNH